MNIRHIIVGFAIAQSGLIFCAYRPSSAPYISGDTFRAIANHWCDDVSTNINPDAVKPGDIIFIDPYRADLFFGSIHPRIKSPYILIAHNGDHSIVSKYRSFLDDSKIIAWFAENSDYEGQHPKLILIPIGLSNKHWPHSFRHDENINDVKNAGPWSKKNLLYANINPQTNLSYRLPIYNFFKTLPFCTWSANVSHDLFLKDLAESKFVLSPHGGGLDCHRTWEALHVGSFPLVKKSTLDPLYEGLPVLIVNDWSEVTQEFLETKYEEMKAGSYRYEKLYFDYWHDLIKSCQQPYQNQSIQQ